MPEKVAGYTFGWPSSLSDDDKHGLLALYNEVAKHEGTLGFYGELNNETGHALVESYGRALESGAIHILTVHDPDGMVGTLTLEQPALHARRHIIDLKRCVIARRSRGQFMLHGWVEAKRRAAELGGEILTLEVRDDGPVELWKSIGFQPYGFLQDYARRGDRSISGHFLYFKLNVTDAELT